MGINKINSVVLSQEIKELLSSLASIVYVNNELNKKYNKSEVYNRQEIEDKFAKILGGTPPEMVDTIVELANALNNDPQFAKTIIAELSKKVDKVNGKQLSTENYSTEEKNKLANIQANAQVNPNAQEILLQLKTVDGSNSGLDADMLEGKEGDYYLNYKNFTNIPDVYTKNESNQLLNGKANANHGHDDKYYTETEIDNMLVNISLSADKIIKEKITEINDKLDETKMATEHIEGLGAIDLSGVEDGYINIDRIEGNTLGNLLGNQGTKNIKFDKSVNDSYRSAIYTVNLIANKEYTLICNVKNLNTMLRCYGKKLDESGMYPDPYVTTNVGVVVKKIIFSETIKYFYLYIEQKDFDDGKTAEFNNVMILEGDYTNKIIPTQYFEGIKSVQDIKITSVYKNLINFNNPITFKPGIDAATDYFSFISSPIFSIALYNNGELLPDVGNDGLILSLFDEDKKYIDGWTLWSNPRNKIDTSPYGYVNKVRYARLIARPTLQKEMTITNVMINEGSTVLPYEPYKENKIDILSELAGDKALKRLPNGVADIYHADGVVDRKIGKMMLDSSGNWSDVDVSKGKTLIARYSNPSIKDANEREYNCISNNFPSIKALFYEDVEGINIANNNNSLWLRVSKSKLTQYGFKEGDTTTYVPAFKAYLNANPTMVLYELAEPTTEQLDILKPLKCWKGGSLVVESDIPVPLTISYPTNFNSEVKSIEDALGKIIENQGELDNKLSNIEVPVKSVNSKTGAVVLGASDIKTNSNKTVQGELDECRSTSNGLGQYINSAIGQLQNDMGDMSNRVQNIDENINNNYTRIQEGTTLPTTNTKNLTFLKKL